MYQNSSKTILLTQFAHWGLTIAPEIFKKVNMHSQFVSALIIVMSDFKFPEKLRNNSVNCNEND